MVQERTGELIRVNEQLSQEIEERKGTEESLRSAYAENKQLKDRFQAENIYLYKDIDREFNFGEIIGRSNALVQVFFKVELVPFFFFIRIIKVPAFFFLGFWIIFQIISSLSGEAGIAWFAHIGGFAAGLILAPIFKKK